MCKQKGKIALPLPEESRNPELHKGSFHARWQSIGKRQIGVLPLLLVCVVALLGQDTPPSDKQRTATHNREQLTEKFKGTIIGQMLGPDGSPLAFRTFEGSAGSIVVATYGTLGSTDKATALLRLWLQASKKVIQDDQKKNSSGQVIGQRAVATFIGKQNTEYTAIFWTNDSDCFRIQAPTLTIALHFEERINNGLQLTDD